MIWPTFINIEQLKCEWWNEVLYGIDACGNEIWSYWLGGAVWAVSWHSAVDESHWKKVNQRSIVGRHMTHVMI